MHVNFVMDASQQNCIQLGNPVRSWLALYYGCGHPQWFWYVKIIVPSRIWMSNNYNFFCKSNLGLFQLLRIFNCWWLIIGEAMWGQWWDCLVGQTIIVPGDPPFLSVIACRNQKQKLGPIKQAHFHSLNIHPLKIQALLHAAC